MGTGIKYLCYDCRQEYGGVKGFPAINEIGRKRCDVCGSSLDDLEVFGGSEFEALLKKGTKQDKKS